MQVYHDLSILTARPTKEDMAEVPHHLYGTFTPNEICDAGTWLSQQHKILPEVWQRGKIPILVGGTGLYIRALTQGLAPVPSIPQSVRDQVTQDYETMGPEVFSAFLAEKDPLSAAEIPATNRQRMIRAMEVVDHTGQPLSWWKKQPHHGGLPRAPVTLVLEPERVWLYERCDRRFQIMLEEGALSQVRDLMAKGIGPDAPICRGLGARALMSYLNEKITYETAIAQAQKETRNYAKRQLTWFRNQVKADIRLYPPQSDIQSSDALNRLQTQVLMYL